MSWLCTIFLSRLLRYARNSQSFTAFSSIMKLNKQIKLLFLSIILIASYALTAQVAVTTDGSSADPSAMLDVKSTSRGLLPPRMTTAERDAISSPADGLIIFNTTSGCLNFYAGGYWNETCGIADIPTVYNPTTGKTWMDRNIGASQVATSSTDATTALPNGGNSWDNLNILLFGVWAKPQRNFIKHQ